MQDGSVLSSWTEASVNEQSWTAAQTCAFVAVPTSVTIGMRQGGVYHLQLSSTSHAGWIAEARTQGFTTDRTPPLVGLVMVGGQRKLLPGGVHDISYQRCVSLGVGQPLSVGWYGFADETSGIASWISAQLLHIYNPIPVTSTPLPSLSRTTLAFTNRWSLA